MNSEITPQYKVLPKCLEIEVVKDPKNRNPKNKVRILGLPKGKYHLVVDLGSGPQQFPNLTRREILNKLLAHPNFCSSYAIPVNGGKYHGT